MWHYGLTQSQHCKNDDIVIMVTMWYGQVGGLNPLVSKPMIYGGKCDNKERDLKLEDPFPRVLGYKKRIDIKEVGITEFRVYMCQDYMTFA